MCCVGIKSDTSVILVTSSKIPSEISSCQHKIFKIDEHLGMCFSGLMADGRILCNYMRNECNNHRFTYDSPILVGRLVRQAADKAQFYTNRSDKRPYGMGLLIAGFDDAGPHLFQTCPSGNYYDCIAIAIGTRSQAAKSYLERNFDCFKTLNLEDLIHHGMKALEATFIDGYLEKNNCLVAYIGANLQFTVLNE